ncbi:MAG: YceI family protein [Bacteroidia bacterium]
METAINNEVKMWAVDPTHSSVHFAVKHMVISKTKGAFGNYSIKAETKGSDFENSKIELEIEVNSIDTKMADRDNHLRSADFFNAEQFPVIRFVSTEMKKISDEEYLLSGNITIKDITKPITFNVSYGGQTLDPWGNLRTGFTLEGKIDRFDFGLTWNTLLETGGAMVGKEVKLEAEIEMVGSK